MRSIAAYRKVRASWVLAAVLTAAAHAAAQDISVQAVIEKNEAYVGEAVVFQIQIDGVGSVEHPELRNFEGFSVEPLGGKRRSGQSVTVVNGRVHRVVTRQYIISYHLTPLRAGDLRIPPVHVTVGDQTFVTREARFRAHKPEEPDFKLSVTLSKNRCYVGEPILLNVKWYIGMDVREFAFTVPILEDVSFLAEDVEVPQGRSRNLYRIPVGSEEVIGEQVQERLDGKTYAALTFEKVLIPQKAGSFSFPEATVACEALVGRGRRRSAFDDFFRDDFFSMGRRGTYRRFVTSSNPLSVEVVALPEAGRPAKFSGLVGIYAIEIQATPREVNVGDPITLTVRVSGHPYLKHFELPPLGEFPELASRFKIPVEMAPAESTGTEKVFTQTLRALDDTVTEVPSLELNYFDTRAGAYRVAKSDAIPLHVRPTKVVTAADAEGRELPPVRNQLTAWREGIAHNYEDPGVLANQAYGPMAVLRSPLWMTLTGSPPAAYLLLLTGVFARRRERANPELRKAKRAHGVLDARLKSLETQARSGEASVYGDVLEALRNYLGDKLNVPAGALTSGDAGMALAERGVDEEVVAGIRAVFETCEAQRYAGGQDVRESALGVVERAQDLAKALERELR